MQVFFVIKLGSRYDCNENMPCDFTDIWHTHWGRLCIGK